MNRARWELGLWTITIVVSVVLAAELRSSAPRKLAAPSSIPAASSRRERSFMRDSVLAAARFIALHDPFRVSHEPASVPYGAAPAATAPPITRPKLVLHGIVGGAGEWRAVLSGVPGKDGTIVVQPGDTTGGLRVGRVTANSATIQGRDTTWTLALSVPWP